jgi:hypothetical protein
LAFIIFDSPKFLSLTVSFQVQTTPARFATLMTITAQMIYCQTKRARFGFEDWIRNPCNQIWNRKLNRRRRVATGLRGTGVATQAQQLTVQTNSRTVFDQVIMKPTARAIAQEFKHHIFRRDDR